MFLTSITLKFQFNSYISRRNWEQLALGWTSHLTQNCNWSLLITVIFAISAFSGTFISKSWVSAIFSGVFSSYIHKCTLWFYRSQVESCFRLSILSLRAFLQTLNTWCWPIILIGWGNGSETQIFFKMKIWTFALEVYMDINFIPSFLKSSGQELLCRGICRRSQNSQDVAAIHAIKIYLFLMWQFPPPALQMCLAFESLKYSLFQEGFFLQALLHFYQSL